MALNRNMGSRKKLIQSICWKVFMKLVMPIPKLAKPKAISTEAGMTRMAHQLVSRPITPMTAVKPVAYRRPRRRARKISPMATSSGPRDV
ncbi:hypothetical protein D3C73_1191880 [compost metagenome]